MSGDSFNWKAIILWIPFTCFYSVTAFVVHFNAYEHFNTVRLYILLLCYFFNCIISYFYIFFLYQAQTKRGGIHFIFTKALHFYTNNSSRQCHVSRDIATMVLLGSVIFLITTSWLLTRKQMRSFFM